jgi:hypothetical protein
MLAGRIAVSRQQLPLSLVMDQISRELASTHLPASGRTASSLEAGKLVGSKSQIIGAREQEPRLRAA